MLRISQDEALADRLGEVVDVLRRGGVAVLPTDTVYGVCALADDAAAVAKLFAAKGRGQDVPVAVLCADVEQALAAADQALPPAARELAATFWPGPLTLVLRRRAGLAWELGGSAETVGLRCPDHELVRAVAAAAGPVAASSANRHGEPVAPTALAAAASLVHEPDLVVDGGRLDGLASTVVDATAAELRVLRQGALRLPSGG